jgi:hypothetical protein
MIGPEMETPMTVLAFRQPDKDAKLAQLAVDIRQHLHASAASAIEAGRMLIEAKAMLRHGDWLPWLRVHVEISGRTASDYMRLARDPNSQHAADLSIRAALEQQRAGKKHQQAEGKKAATGQYIMLATLGEPIAYPCPASPALFNTTNEHISWAAFSPSRPRKERTFSPGSSRCSIMSDCRHPPTPRCRAMPPKTLGASASLS